MKITHSLVLASAALAVLGSAASAAIVPVIVSGGAAGAPFLQQVLIDDTTGLSTGSTSFVTGATFGGYTATAFTGLAASADQSILYVNAQSTVANAGSRILSFDSATGNFLGTVASFSSAESTTGPDALAFRNNALYASFAFGTGTRAASVAKIDLANANAVSAAVTGLSTPRGLSFDNSGNLFISNRGTGRVLKSDLSSTTATVFSTVATPNASFFDGTNVLTSSGFGTIIVSVDPVTGTATQIHSRAGGGAVLDIDKVGTSTFYTDFNTAATVGGLYRIDSATTATRVATLNLPGYIQVVPEPTSLGLLGLGGLALLRRRRA